MLVGLHVKNLALIEEAELSFTKGLNIITGETGAGKSILIGSINAALGGKVSADFIRNGAEYGLVELNFLVDNPHTIEALKELDVVDVESGEVLLSRKITAGRSTIKVNGEQKSVAEVKKIASLLIDIHGQHEHQSLLNKINYIPIIDKYAKEELAEYKLNLAEEYNRYKECKKRCEEFNLDPDNIKREIAFMEYEINEIETANVVENEDSILEENFQIYNNSKKIMDGINEAKSYLTENTYNASDAISRSIRAVSQAAEYDPKNLNNILSQLTDLEDILNGLNADIENYCEKMEFDEEEFQNIGDRLSIINSLKAKYGNSIREILDYKKSKLDKFREYENYEINKQEAIKAMEESRRKVLEICELVTIIRRKAAETLSEKIKEALLELNFLDVRFNIVINESETFNENGNNEAEFLISTNPGQVMAPLSRVASGGELSRVMLAIKTVLSDKDEIEALIFDEIDTGISGRTAQMVAVKLAQNSMNHQVICITHLPQIASMADSHFMIEKVAEKETTYTHITTLAKDESIFELARLLGGSSITTNVVNNAKEMLELAKTEKEKCRKN